jgi:hypothetical protein
MYWYQVTDKQTGEIHKVRADSDQEACEACGPMPGGCIVQKVIQDPAYRQVGPTYDGGGRHGIAC